MRIVSLSWRDVGGAASEMSLRVMPQRRIELPTWPVFVLFAGYPLWWFVGLGAFAVVLASVPMVVLLVVKGGVQAPRVLAFWVGFLVCTVASGVMLGGADKVVGYGTRMANYLAATAVFLYVYNASRSRLTDRRVLIAMCCYLATLVAGGWLGVLVPNGRIESIVGRLLPSAIASNSYVDALVNPSFAEVQHPWGSPFVFNRPSAPLPYTNGWGLNFTLLVFFGFAMIVGFRTLLSRLLVVGLLLAGTYPALQTGNRGMLLGIAVFMGYGVVRFALRGRVGPLVSLVVIGAIATAVAVPALVEQTLSSRLAYSQSNDTRTSVYFESLRGALDSPLLGNGGPQTSTTVDVSLGTQGQLWNVLFSYGFVALGFFVAWFVAAAWMTRRAVGGPRLWLHVAASVPLLTMVYYGFDGPQLAIAMVAAAVALRPLDRDHQMGAEARSLALASARTGEPVSAAPGVP